MHPCAPSSSWRSSPARRERLRSSSSSTSSCSASSTTTRPAKLFRGRNLSQEQLDRRRARVQPRRVEVRAVRRLRPPDAARQPRRLVPQQPAGDDRDPRGAVADRLPRRHGDAAGDGDRHRRRDLRRMATTRRVRHHVDVDVDAPLLRTRLLAGHGPAVVVRRALAVVPDRRVRGRRQLVVRSLGPPRPGPPHGAAGAHADAGVHRRVHDRDAVVDPRHRQRGVHPVGPRQGSAGVGCPSPARRAQRPAPRRQPLGVELRLRAVRGDRRRSDLLVAGHRTGHARGDSWPGLPDAAGPVPAQQRGGDHPQPGRRPDPRLARPSYWWQDEQRSGAGHRTWCHRGRWCVHVGLRPSAASGRRSAATPWRWSASRCSSCSSRWRCSHQ